MNTGQKVCNRRILRLILLPESNNSLKMALKLSKQTKFSFDSNSKQDFKEFPLLSPRTTTNERTPRRTATKFLHTKAPGDSREFNKISEVKSYYNGFNPPKSSIYNTPPPKESPSSNGRFIFPAHQRNESRKNEISLFQDSTKKATLSTPVHKKIHSDPDAILVTEYDRSPPTTSRLGIGSVTARGSGFAKGGGSPEELPSNPRNIRSYPSKRLIFQKKLEDLKTKIKENEDVNLDEYQDLEDWFETLNLKFNDVLFSNTYDIFIYTPEMYNLTWKPSSREGATLNKVGEYVVLYGGTSSGYADDLVLYEPKRSRWFIPDLGETKPTFNRHGHSAISYHNFLVIFGGERQNLYPGDIRELLDDVWMFDVKAHSFKKFPTKGSHGDRILQNSEDIWHQVDLH